MTAVVSGMKPIDDVLTVDGTEVHGTITGDVGIFWTTTYDVVGTFVGILFGVTNGVVN